MASQHKTGGLLELGQLRQKLISSRGRSQQDISVDDLLRATKKLKILGNITRSVKIEIVTTDTAGTGFTVIPLNSGRYLVQSVPGEMSLDQVSVLDQAEKNRGLVTGQVLVTDLGWDKERSDLVLGEEVVTESASDCCLDQSEWWRPARSGWTVRRRGEAVSTGYRASSAPLCDQYILNHRSHSQAKWLLAFIMKIYRSHLTCTMVLHFPSKLTDEEEALQLKYAKLRRKKKQLQEVRIET